MSSISDTRRPLTARSVIASTLLGVDPPRLPALALVRSGELFGLREGATRTALSRMAAAGEVAADDGHYALAGPLLERHERQRSAREGAAHGEWDGTWLVGVVTPGRRSAAARAGLRTAAARCRLAEVREGVWTRPDDGVAARAPEALTVLDDQVDWLRSVRPDDPAAMLAGFDLDGWAAHARHLLDELLRWQPDLDEGRTEVLADTFVVNAAVLRHLVADPMLPAELAPQRWPGPELRAAFGRFDAAFKATWRDWYRTFRDR